MADVLDKKNTGPQQSTVSGGLLNIDEETMQELIKSLKIVIDKKKEYWNYIFNRLYLKASSTADPQTLWYIIFLSKLKTEVRLDMEAPAGVYYDYNMDPSRAVKREGYTLVINPIYFSLFDQDEQLAVLKHEVQHIFKMHFFRFNKPDINHTIANIAEDMEINGFFEKPYIRNLPGGVDKPDAIYGGIFIDKIFDDFVERGILKDYDKTEHKEAEYYYDLIMLNPDMKKELELRYDPKNQNGQGQKKPDPNAIRERMKKASEQLENDFNSVTENKKPSKEELQQQIKELEDMLNKLEGNESPEQQQNQQQNQQGQQQNQQGQQQECQGGQCQNQGGSQPQSGQQGQGQQGQQNGQGQQNQQGQQQNQQGQGQQNQNAEGKNKGQAGENEKNGTQQGFGYDLEKVKQNSKEKQDKGKTSVQGGGKPSSNQQQNQGEDGEYNELMRKKNDLITKIAKKIAQNMAKGKYSESLMDDHDLEQDGVPLSPEEKNRRRAKELERVVKNVQDIFDETVPQKDRGYQPGEVEIAIKEIKKLVKPQIDLAKKLRKVISEGATQSIEKVSTRKKLHRMFSKDPNYKGKEKDKLPKLVVILDVSGSMSNLEILAGLNELRNTAKRLNMEIEVIQVDTEVHNVTKVAFNTTSFKRAGNGGTYMEPGFHYIFDKEGPIKYANVIAVITDGYIESDFEEFDIHKHPELKKVIWITTSGELHFDYKKYGKKMEKIKLDPEIFKQAFSAAKKSVKPSSISSPGS